MPQVSRDAVSTPASSPFRIALSNETKPKVMDGKFLLLAGMASAATFADIATTNRCLSSSVNCHESNPLLGSHPSSGKVYGISLSVLAGQMLASAWLRRHNPNRRLWMIPPIAATAAHGIAAALNARNIQQLNATPSP